MQSLQNQFETCCQYFSNDSHWIGGQWVLLDEKYSQPGRHYHNWQHIQVMLAALEEHKNKIEFPEELAYAIFFHDVIYNIHSKKNELKSAELAVEFLSRGNAPEEQADRIYDLILVTKNHQPVQAGDQEWMIDFDLKILGAPTTIYQQYAANTCKEHNFYPDFLYNKGRVKVLQHFLELPFIYQTNEYREQFEKQARENLQGELSLLSC